MDTLTDMIDFYADTSPEARALVFLNNGEEVEASLTYRELRTRSMFLALTMRRYVSRNSRAVLLFPPGLDFIVAFFAALYAGIIAVPQPLQRRHLKKLEAVIWDSGASMVIGPESALARVQRELQMQRPMYWIPYPAPPPTQASDDALEPRMRSDIALLQYTSGTTGGSKGVILTHGNIMANQRHISDCFGHQAGLVGVSWLPAYHDMGLIGGILQPLFKGGVAVLMSPTAFLQKPVRWLAAISRFEAHSSGAPNFAYDICVDRISLEQEDCIDLRHWQVAFVGAESVRSETLERFAQRFARRGLSGGALYPCYGLAEATLFVTGAEKGHGPTIKSFDWGSVYGLRNETNERGERPLRLTSSGRITSHVHVTIIDPSSRCVLPERTLGEIKVDGPSVSPGYWSADADSGRNAYPHIDGALPRTVLTKDLGFVCDGELFVVGRSDDAIVFDGRNFYPQDFEVALSAFDELLNQSRAIVFATLLTGRPELVLAVELNAHCNSEPARLSDIIFDVRQAFADEMNVILSGVQVLPKAALPMTSSGKVKKLEYRRLFEMNACNPLAEWVSRGLRNKLDQGSGVNAPAHP
ncbi:fatty acyl-AMP ligase [Bradyrhizobium prioriisuperbiae]|uniref:fatty acyl-AMP ligase n=1 Tax=Bradyrhizobium prioriisuperbiae TaxID=2854389 RepID=UPI0028F02615|nr:fatty acyl-AMP ligase [Bradyrhizobium prioritasuperba]